MTASARHHILVVDDDLRLRDLLASFLRREGFGVTLAGDVASARQQMQGLVFDAIVLDIMLPDESGLDLLAELGSLAPPVLLLSARGALDDRIAGLNLGADDFLPKPFEPRELVARLGAILRRRPRQEGGEAVVRFGAYRYDISRQVLQDGVREVRLPDAEAAVLGRLSQQLGETLGREELAVGGVSDRAIDVQILRLRRRIETDPRSPRLLETIRGQGYRLRRTPLREPDTDPDHGSEPDSELGP